MCDTLSLVGREALAGTKGMGAVLATCLPEDGATLLTRRAQPGEPRPQGLFVTAVIATTKGRAVVADAVPAFSDGEAQIRKLSAKRDLGAPVQAATGMNAGDQAILNPVEQLLKALAVGFAVFTISLAAFVALFAWWILVVEPSPGVKPMAHVTMPLFPTGYHLPADEYHS
jgi:hypothetical protein